MLKRFVTALCASLLFALLASAPLPVMAQGTPQAPAAAPTAPPGTTISGNIHTSDNIAVPGATLRLVETSTGRAWISWTDENGHFTLPGMAPGHYRVEVAQLGFDPITREFDVTPQGAAPLELVAKVATLQGIEQQSAQAEQSAQAQQSAA
ncbi:MAG TPA: carboxypeptidase-like regulatory domain-containing protein, partial [Candidatus Acidoferrales bacterium]